MRRLAFSLACLVFAGAVVPAPAAAQGLPPHAWLFGTWVGGLFPAPPRMSQEQCFSQPVLVFTRDLVLRATITEQVLTQREIETARATPAGFEFRLAGRPGAGSGLLGSRVPPMVGFGCESADVLHVQKRGENEIILTGCADFPNPLVRCQTK